MALALDEKYAPLLAGAGFVALEVGRREKAERIFDALAAQWPARLAPILGKSLTLVLAGKPEEAVRLLENDGLAHKKDPLWASFHALALAETGQAEAARAKLKALLAEAPGHQDTGMAKALLHHLG